MSSSLGKEAHCDTLVVRELGSRTRPVETIHRASTDRYQNDLNWVDADTGHTRLRLKEDGHLQCVEDVEFFSGPSIVTGTKRFSVGLSGTTFVIRDEVNGVDLLTLNSGESVTGLGAQLAALNAKQDALTVNGSPIHTTVLSSFALTSGGDGTDYATSLVTAGALENFIENTLQPSLITVQAGQSAGVRIGTINPLSPSSTNVPSALAVSNFVHTVMPLQFETSSVIGVKPGVTVTKLKVPALEFTGTDGGGDSLRTFNRFKTTPAEMLNDNDDAPISCQAYLTSGTNAVFAATHAQGYHKLSPSGKIINEHLTTLLYASKVKFGQGAASTSQGDDAVAIGLNAGQNQSDLSVAIGKDAGKLNQQYSCIAIGYQAGENQQGGINSYSIAIGSSAGQTNQDFSAIAMGHRAGANDQSYETVAIGSSAGYNQQGIYAIAIGGGAGQQSQGAYAISIGHFPPGVGNTVSTAGQFQQSANSIVLNASGNDLHGNLGTGRFYVDPIRNATTSNVLYYDPTTKEITHDAIGSGTTFTDPISIGTGAGATSQGTSSIAIGTNAGNNTQDVYSVAIGREAGQTNQGGGCVAIGNNAGNSNQSNGNGYAVAIGWEAGQTNQGEKTFAMGVRAGNLNQGAGSFALGEQAGETGQGASCIAIGKQAGETNQNDNTIVLNAQGTPLNTTASNGFYVAPIATGTTGNYLQYNTTTKQITYDSGAITAPTYNTTALPTLTTEIGYNDEILIPSGVVIPQFTGTVLFGTFVLVPGVWRLDGAYSVDGQPSEATYGSTSIFADPALTGPYAWSSWFAENFTVVVVGGFTTNYLSATIVVPYGTTKTVEFRGYVNSNAVSSIQTAFASRYKCIRIA